MSATTSEAAPGATCTCGHFYRHHYAQGGPCLCAHKLKSGKYADSTVCPCSAYEPRDD